jgi:bifunctional non-homologous end joining protein LigD
MAPSIITAAARKAGAGQPHPPITTITDKVPLEVPPPRDSRFGSPLVLSRVHWVRPELVAEVKYLTWTDDNLLRQVVYEGLREDKPAAKVRRAAPHPQPAAAATAVRPRRPRR